MSKKEIPVIELPHKTSQGELTNAFTGEVFHARARNHYEVNDGKPVAPHVDIARPTVRQRIENLLSRGVDPLARYVGSEGIDMDIPDDPEAPLTPSEMNYMDVLAAELAENAPLPDDELPRNSPGLAKGEVSQSAATSGALDGEEPPEEAPKPAKGDQGGSGGPPPEKKGRTVPTR